MFVSLSLFGVSSLNLSIIVLNLEILEYTQFGHTKILGVIIVSLSSLLAGMKERRYRQQKSLQVNILLCLREGCQIPPRGCAFCTHGISC